MEVKINHKEIVTNWNVITGGPCTEKTTVINILSSRGFMTILEPARHYVEYQSNIEILQARAEGAKAWMLPTLSTVLMRFPYKGFSMLKEEDPMNQAGI